MPKTIYQKIYHDLVTKIKTGGLQSGDILPSTRELAKTYKCHRFTVMRVCQDLVAEAWLESSEKSRYRISLKIPVTSSLKSRMGPKKNDLSLVAKGLPEMTLTRAKYPLEFWGGQPDLRLFPKDEFRRVLSAGLRRIKPLELSYGPADGLHSCLKEVSDYLRKSRNLVGREFIMTNGSQEALLLIFQTFVKPGEKIAVEKKGYPPAWKLFESLGAILIPIEVDAEGLDTEDLKKQMRKHQIKLIYVTPLHQYPTTVTLSPRRRQNLIRLAEQNVIPILEDDYDYEFHYVGPPPPPLSAESTMGIYVCSFSKVLFPGVRLGVIGCDLKIAKNIAAQKYLVSRQTNCLSQIGLSAWIKDGGFERHLRKMRRIYEARYNFMQTELQKIKSKSKIDWHSPNGGMSIWVNLFRDSNKVAEAAKRKGVLFQHESAMDYGQSAGTHLRIGFAGVNEREITEGMASLGSLL